MGAGATTHFTHPLGTAGRVFSYPKAPTHADPDQLHAPAHPVEL